MFWIMKFGKISLIILPVRVSWNSLKSTPDKFPVCLVSSCLGQRASFSSLRTDNEVKSLPLGRVFLILPCLKTLTALSVPLVSPYLNIQFWEFCRFLGGSPWSDIPSFLSSFLPRFLHLSWFSGVLLGSLFSGRILLRICFPLFFPGVRIGFSDLAIL